MGDATQCYAMRLLYARPVSAAKWMMLGQARGSEAPPKVGKPGQHPCHAQVWGIVIGTWEARIVDMALHAS